MADSVVRRVGDRRTTSHNGSLDSRVMVELENWTTVGLGVRLIPQEVARPVRLAAVTMLSSLASLLCRVTTVGRACKGQVLRGARKPSTHYATSQGYYE